MLPLRGCGLARSKFIPFLLLLFQTIFQLTLNFASPNNLNCINIASHNLQAFKKSSAYHKSCLEKYGGIWMGQELWLMEQQLPIMRELGVQFAARSGMEAASSSGVLKGRPFGGVSIAWAPNLNHIVKPIANYRHH